MVEQGFMDEADGENWKAWPLPEARAEQPGRDWRPTSRSGCGRCWTTASGASSTPAGSIVYTTLDLDMQAAAQLSMEEGWTEIESRPGYDHPLYEEYADRTEPFESAEHALPAGDLHRPGSPDRSSPGHDRGTGLPAFQVQSGHAGPPPGRLRPSSPSCTCRALASGIPASHIIVDAPVVLPQVSGEEWKPQNFSEEFLGPITIREGLRRSINMIAIKLGLEVGLETVAQTAQRMGIRTEIERYPSTAIGAAEVIPIQMAEAYSTFATLGTRVRPQPILKVLSPDGEVLWEPQPERTQVLDSLTTRIMVSMLEDVVAQGTAYNAVRVRSELPYEVPAAGKTGTTNDGTNVWFMGFTPNLMAAVWFGMDLPSTIGNGLRGEGTRPRCGAGS